MTLGFGLLQLFLGLFVTVLFFYVLLKFISEPKQKKQEQDNALARAKKHWENTPPDDIL